MNIETAEIKTEKTKTEKTKYTFGNVQEETMILHRLYGVCHKIKCFSGTSVAIAESPNSLPIKATAFSLRLRRPVFIDPTELVTVANSADAGEDDPGPGQFVGLDREMYLARGGHRERISRFDRQEAIFV